MSDNSQYIKLGITASIITAGIFAFYNTKNTPKKSSTTTTNTPTNAPVKQTSAPKGGSSAPKGTTGNTDSSKVSAPTGSTGKGQQTNTAPKSDTPPKSSGTPPKSTGAPPKSTGAPPKSTGKDTTPTTDTTPSDTTETDTDTMTNINDIGNEEAELEEPHDHQVVLDIVKKLMEDESENRVNFDSVDQLEEYFRKNFPDSITEDEVKELADMCYTYFFKYREHVIQNDDGAEEDDDVAPDVEPVGAVPVGNSFFVKGKTEWHNHIDNVVVENIQIIKVESKEDLLVNMNMHPDAKMKAIGSGHSYSRVCDTTGFIYDITKMDNMQVLKYVDGKRHFVLVDCGILLKNLVTALRKKGLALINLGGYDGQTLAGVISTATHGSGIGIGSFADMVHVVTIATTGRLDDDPDQTPLAKLYTFCRESAPTALKNAIPNTIANDDYFKSVACSFGSMGIMCQVVLEVVEDYDIHQVADFITIDNILDHDWVDNCIRVAGANSRIEFWIDPYPTKLSHDDKEIVHALRISRDVDVKHLCHLSIKEKVLAFIKKQRLLSETVSTLQRLSGELYKDSLISSLKTQVGTYTNYYDMVTITGLNENSGFAFEVGVRLGDGDGPLDLTNLNRVVEFVLNYVNTDQSVLMALVSIRFIAQSDLYVSMNSGSRIAMFEIQMLNPATMKRRQVLIDYLTKLEAALIENIGPELIVHWGLDFDQISDTQFNVYPHSETWKNVYRQLNKHQSFSNWKTDRLKLDVKEE